MKKTIIQSLSIVLVMTALWSCSGNTNQTEEQATADTAVVVNEEEHVNRILFSVPSPLESALMIQDCGIPYNAKAIHDVKKSRDYASATQKALNMGIYVTDLSYSNVFGQTSNAVNTFQAVQDLANQLDIDYIIDEELLNKLDQNINNRRMLMRLTTEVYNEVRMELSESEMEYVNALIIAGAWMEGMYITTVLLDEIVVESKVVQRIANQKDALSNLILLLSSYGDNPNVQGVLEDFKRIENVYNDIEVVVGTKQVEVNDSEVSVKGGSQLNIIPEQVEEIKVLVNEIRTSYVEA